MARLRRGLLALGLAFAGTLAGGCGAVISNVSAGMADSLSTAILNQEDPQLVRDALPSYLLLLDSLVESDPYNSDTLAAAAQLYAAYGAAFVSEPERAATLTRRARDYGQQALCAAEDDACGLDSLDFDEYSAVIAGIDDDALTELYSYSLSTLAWIRTNSTDFNALAKLPNAEVALTRVIELDDSDEYSASTSMYLGVLNTLRPESLGGRPEVGREWFERGIELSGGRDLSIKVEFARGYARLLYDRALHDRLLNEVLDAEVKQPELTLFNQLARVQAQELLATADDYF